MDEYKVTITYLVTIKAENEDAAIVKAVEEIEQGYWEYADAEVE